MEPPKRQFANVNTVPKCLFCFICSQIYFSPQRLFCGHTICLTCLNMLLARPPARCPQCRKEIVEKDIGTDLIAQSIIDELEILCASEECPWRGQYRFFEKHMEECVLKEKKGKKKKNKPTFELIDDEVMDKINDNVVKGTLSSRLFMKTQSLNLQNKTESRKSSSKKEHRNSGYDFLQQLFD